mmetsp:Transcript_31690/g.106754  ORF Transcript_31690/g.106754 Transcript_31690/m.106754 type:complete len:214 (-) Transcript_31690:224-865(-)
MSGSYLRRRSRKSWTWRVLSAINFFICVNCGVDETFASKSSSVRRSWARDSARSRCAAARSPDARASEGSSLVAAVSRAPLPCADAIRRASSRSAALSRVACASCCCIVVKRCWSVLFDDSKAFLSLIKSMVSSFMLFSLEILGPDLASACRKSRRIFSTSLIRASFSMMDVSICSRPPCASADSRRCLSKSTFIDVIFDRSDRTPSLTTIWR